MINIESFRTACSITLHLEYRGQIGKQMHKL